jgi:hypothetical protein
MAEETPDIGGMTVNERLYRFGLMPAFDDAVRSRKVEAVIAVLRQAQFSQSQARVHGHNAIGESRALWLLAKVRHLTARC